MKIRHFLPKNRLFSAPGPLAVLLFAWSGVAIGATGLETRCDQSVRASDMPETRPASFSIEVADASDTSDIDDMAAPLVSDQSESLKEAAPKANSDETVDTSARLPGVSEDDLIRFKRQMYRKDI